jgi:long-chain fatty acid transport protein
MISPRGTYTPYSYPSDALPFTGIFTDERENTPKNFFVPSLGIHYKASEKMVLGLAVQAPFGLGAEWDVFFVPEGYGNDDALSKEKEHFSDHMVISIQPTVAFKLSDRISMGIGLNYMWGKMTLDAVTLVPNPISGMWSMLEPFFGPWNPDWNRLIAEANLEGDGSAFGANVGLLFKLSDKLSLGLNGRYQTDLKLSGKVTQNVAMPGNATLYAAIAGADPSLFGGVEQQQQLLALFSGADQKLFDDEDMEVSMPLPWTIGAGIAYRATDCFTITLDASMTNWSAWDVLTVEPAEGEETELIMDWKNTIEIGGGFEYKVMNKEEKQMFIRGGFYTVDTPSPNETMSIALLDPKRRFAITGGLGLNLSKINFNLAFEYYIFGDNDITEYDPVFDSLDPVPYENYAGVYKMNAMVITLGTQISL